MLKRALYTVLSMCAVLMVFASQVQAQPYSERTLRGVWVFQGSGNIGGTPAVNVGRQVFDGRGNCTLEGRLNFGGTVIPLTTERPGGSCVYTVDSNGLGHQEITVVDPGGVASTFLIDVALINKGEYFWTSSDSLGNTVAHGTTRRQRP